MTMNCCYEQAVTIPVADGVLIAPGGTYTAAGEAGVSSYITPKRGAIQSITVVGPSVGLLKVRVIDAENITSHAQITSVVVGASGVSITNGVASAVMGTGVANALPETVRTNAGVWVAKLLSVDLGNSQDGAGLAVNASTYIPCGGPNGLHCPGGMLVWIENVDSADSTGAIVLSVTIVYDTPYG